MKRRSAKQKFLIFVAVAVVVVVAAAGAFHTPTVRSLVLSYARDYAQQQGIQLDASRLDYNLLTLSLSLEGVRLQALESPDLPSFFEAQSVSLNIAALPLLQGVLNIQEGHLENVLLRGVIDEQGRMNLPAAPEAADHTPSQPGDGLAVLIESLQADGSRIFFEDRRLGLTIDLPGWRLLVEGHGPTRNHRVLFQVEQPGAAVYQGRTTPLRQLEFNGTLDQANLEVENFGVAAEDNTLLIKGSVQNFEDPVLDIQLELDADTHQVARLADVDLPVQGRVRVQAGIANSLRSLQISADVSGSDLTLGEFKQLALEAHSEWNRETQRLTIDSLSVRSPAGRLQLQADSATAPSAGPGKLNAQVSNLDLRPVTRQLDLPLQVASRATGTLGANWEGLDFEQALGEAKLTLAKQQDRPRKGVLPISSSLSAKVRSDRAELSISTLETLGGRFEGKISLESGEKLGGWLGGNVDSLAELTSSLDSLLGESDAEPLLGLKLDGGARLSATLNGTLRKPRLSADFEGQDLAVGELRGVSVRVSGEYDPTRVQLTESRITWQGQTLSAQGEVALEDPSPRLALQAYAKRSSIASILAGLQKDIPIEGLVDAEAVVRGTIANPNVIVEISGSELRAYGESLGALAARAQLADQQVELTQFRLNRSVENVEAGYLEASGSYDLDSSAYSFQLEGKRLQFASLTLPKETPVSGEASLAAAGSGTLERPELNVHFEVADLRIREKFIGTVDIEANLRNQVLNLQAGAPRFALKATAEARAVSPYAIEFTLLADHSDLSNLDVEILEGKPLGGTLAAEIRGSGDLERWREGALHARIAALEVIVDDQEISSDGDIVLGFENQVLDVRPSTVVWGDSRVSISGSLPLKGASPPGTLNAQGDLNLETLLTLIPHTQPLAANGRLNFHAGLRGSLEQVEPSLEAELKRVGLYTPALIMPFTDVGAAIRLHSGSIVLENGSAEWAGAELTLAGELPLGLLPLDLPLATLAPPQTPASARLDLGVKGLVINSISALPREVGGTISLNLHAEAPSLDLASVTGEARFDELKLNYEEFEISQQDPTVITVQNGEARLERLSLHGPNTQIDAGGSLRLNQPSVIDIKLNGHTDIGILSLPLEDVHAAGGSRFELAVGGELDSPQLTGRFELDKGQFNLESPSLQAEDLNIALAFDKDGLSIESFTGTLNGGSLRAGGAIALSGMELKDLQVDIVTNNVFLNVPDGLNTLSEANVTLRSRQDLILVGGSARILEGSYTEPVELDRFLFDYLRSRDVMPLVEEPNPFLSRIRYDFQLDTEGPLLIDNNVAQLAAEAHLRLLGSYYRPGLTGRITLEEGGELYISENRYLIDRGALDFRSETRIEPAVNILARTEAGRYDVTLQVSGGGSEDISTTLTSEPPLPEPDIISVLLTGRTLDEVRGAEVNVVQEQALSYVTGSLGGRLSRSARETLGLSEVRIEPNLIAAESDPGARLTIGQDITRDLGLIYSMNLADSSDQIWIAEYDVTRRFTTQGVKQADNSYRFDLRHDFRFGGPPGSDRSSRPSKEARKVGAVEFHAPDFPPQQLAKTFGITEGDTYDFFKVRSGVSRLENSLAKQDHLESRVRLARSSSNNTIDLTVEIDAGPQVELLFEGADIPGATRQSVRRIWRQGVFDAQRAEASVQTIRAFFVKNGYLEPDVKHSIETMPENRKLVAFQIDPGIRYRNVNLEFEGASAFTNAQLVSELEKADLKTAVYTEPRKVADFLTNLYRQQGYLDAQVQRPRYELDPQTASGRVVFTIDEGPWYRITEVEFRGNRALTDTSLRSVLPFAVQQQYGLELVRNTLVRLEELYWSQGYNDVLINYSLNKGGGKGDMKIVFGVEENEQSIVRDIEIQGNAKTSKDLALRQSALRTGVPLNFEDLNRARKNLYDIGAYSLVEIEREEIEQPAPHLEAGQKPVRVNVKLREVSPYDLRYGGFFDTERGPGAILDLTNRNSLGSARVLGFRTRYDADLKEVRGYLSQPQLRQFPVKTNFVGFLRREIQSAFITDRRGVSVQQEVRLSNRFILSYGYRFENAHTFEIEPDPLLPFDVSLNVAPLNVTLSRDTRDEILDASRGSFASQAFEFAPAMLGSDLRFIKYFGQFFKYVPLSGPGEMPFGKGLMRSRLVYAGGVRIGLAKGLGGQSLVPSERFFAGGGTTVRGFEQDALGPEDFFGDATGGDAVFVTNNEIRFPLVSIFDGVGFLDIGNVYSGVADFNPFEVRKSAGFGLRVRTPYFLLRADYGFKLDRRPGESAGTFFFSIGQAF